MSSTTRNVCVLLLALVLGVGTSLAKDQEDQGWYLSFLAGLIDGIQTTGEWATDGVDVLIAVNDGGKSSEEVWSGTVKDLGWEKYLVDISDYAGKEISLEVSVSAGKQGNANFDWFVLAEPALMNEFTPVVSLLREVKHKKETVIISEDGKDTVLSDEEFGSRAYAGKFTSKSVEKEEIYIHPPFKGDVVGSMRVTFPVKVAKPKNWKEHEL